MSQTNFLFDENVPPTIRNFLLQTNPNIVAFAVGDGIAPPKGTLDPAILDWIAARNCWLVTNNRASMPVHLNDHLADGKHIPGIIQLPRRLEVRLIVADLVLLWTAAEPDEFQDQLVHLPL